MTQKRISIWLATLFGIPIIISSTIPTKIVFAQSVKAQLEFRPHCTQEQQEKDGDFAGDLPDIDQIIKEGSGRCPTFHIRDPLLRETPVLKIGDTLDMDLILKQPSAIPIHRVRVWIAYDPTIFKGDLLEINDQWIDRFPGEQDFSPNEGYVKIGVGNPTDGIAENEIIIARIRFSVIETPVQSTIINFYDQTVGPEGHTVAISGRNTNEENQLLSEQESLMVQLDFVTNETEEVAEQPHNEIAPSKDPSPTHQSPPENPFSLLQAQSVAVTTENDVVYLAWDPIVSKNLIGYNITYGAKSGEYIQRRSVDASATSTTIRGLPKGVRYYFAIRGVSTDLEESAFSHEVAVVVADPSSSTSPLAANIVRTQGPDPRTPIIKNNIPGTTGTASVISLFIIISAAIGTILAFKRQLMLTNNT